MQLGMKKITPLLLFVLLCVTLIGCSLPRHMFSLFSDNYSGGGESNADKERHFEQQLNAGQSNDFSSGDYR
jgi:hypothetical protein